MAQVQKFEKGGVYTAGNSTVAPSVDTSKIPVETTSTETTPAATSTDTTAETTPVVATKAAVVPERGKLIFNGKSYDMTDELYADLISRNTSDRNRVVGSIRKGLDALNTAGNVGYYDSDSNLFRVVDANGNTIYDEQGDWKRRTGTAAQLGRLVGSYKNNYNMTLHDVFNGATFKTPEASKVKDEDLLAYTDLDDAAINITRTPLLDDKGNPVKDKNGKQMYKIISTDKNLISANKRLSDVMSYISNPEEWLKYNRFKDSSWKTYLDSDDIQKLYGQDGASAYWTGLQDRLRNNTLSESDETLLKALNITLGQTQPTVAAGDGTGTKTPTGRLTDETGYTGFTGGNGGTKYYYRDGKYYVADDKGNAKSVTFDPFNQYVSNAFGIRNILTQNQRQYISPLSSYGRVGTNDFFRFAYLDPTTNKVVYDYYKRDNNATDADKAWTKFKVLTDEDQVPWNEITTFNLNGSAVQRDDKDPSKIISYQTDGTKTVIDPTNENHHLEFATHRSATSKYNGIRWFDNAETDNTAGHYLMPIEEFTSRYDGLLTAEDKALYNKLYTMAQTASTSGWLNQAEFKNTWDKWTKRRPKLEEAYSKNHVGTTAITDIDSILKDNGKLPDKVNGRKIKFKNKSDGKLVQLVSADINTSAKAAGQTVAKYLEDSDLVAVYENGGVLYAKEGTEFSVDLITPSRIKTETVSNRVAVDPALQKKINNLRTAGAATALTGAGVGLAGGVTGAIGGVIGLGGDATLLAADWMDPNVSKGKAIGTFAVGTLLSLASIIPGLSSIKAGRAITTAGKTTAKLAESAKAAKSIKTVDTAVDAAKTIENSDEILKAAKAFETAASGAAKSKTGLSTIDKAIDAAKVGLSEEIAAAEKAVTAAKVEGATLETLKGAEQALSKLSTSVSSKANGLNEALAKLTKEGGDLTTKAKAILGAKSAAKMAVIGGKTVGTGMMVKGGIDTAENIANNGKVSQEDLNNMLLLAAGATSIAGNRYRRASAPAPEKVNHTGKIGETDFTPEVSVGKSYKEQLASMQKQHKDAGGDGNINPKDFGYSKEGWHLLKRPFRFRAKMVETPQKGEGFGSRTYRILNYNPYKKTYAGGAYANNPHIMPGITAGAMTADKKRPTREITYFSPIYKNGGSLEDATRILMARRGSALSFSALNNVLGYTDNSHSYGEYLAGLEDLRKTQEGWNRDQQDRYTKAMDNYGDGYWDAASKDYADLTKGYSEGQLNAFNKNYDSGNDFEKVKKLSSADYSAMFGHAYSADKEKDDIKKWDDYVRARAAYNESYGRDTWGRDLAADRKAYDAYNSLSDEAKSFNTTAYSDVLSNAGEKKFTRNLAQGDDNWLNRQDEKWQGFGEEYKDYTGMNPTAPLETLALKQSLVAHKKAYRITKNALQHVLNSRLGAGYEDFLKHRMDTQAYDRNEDAIRESASQTKSTIANSSSDAAANNATIADVAGKELSLISQNNSGRSQQIDSIKDANNTVDNQNRQNRNTRAQKLAEFMADYYANEGSAKNTMVNAISNDLNTYLHQLQAFYNQDVATNEYADSQAYSTAVRRGDYNKATEILNRLSRGRKRILPFMQNKTE